MEETVPLSYLVMEAAGSLRPCLVNWLVKLGAVVELIVSWETVADLLLEQCLLSRCYCSHPHLHVELE